MSHFPTYLLPQKRLRKAWRHQCRDSRERKQNNVESSCLCCCLRREVRWQSGICCILAMVSCLLFVTSDELKNNQPLIENFTSYIASVIECFRLLSNHSDRLGRAAGVNSTGRTNIVTEPLYSLFLSFFLYHFPTRFLPASRLWKQARSTWRQRAEWQWRRQKIRRGGGRRSSFRIVDFPFLPSSSFGGCSITFFPPNGLTRTVKLTWERSKFAMIFIYLLDTELKYERVLER